jgi:hypothetical protein
MYNIEAAFIMKNAAFFSKACNCLLEPKSRAVRNISIIALSMHTSTCYEYFSLTINLKTIEKYMYKRYEDFIFENHHLFFSFYKFPAWASCGSNWNLEILTYHADTGAFITKQAQTRNKTYISMKTVAGREVL